MYHTNNKQKLKEIASKHFDCICGGSFTFAHKKRHKNSDKHKAYMKHISNILKDGQEQLKKVDEFLIDIYNFIKMI